MLPQIPDLDENWRETLRLEARAVVFCWAVWNPMDKIYGANLERVVPDYKGRFAFFTADLDDDTLVPFFTGLNAVSCPLLLLLTQGVEVDRNYGYMSEPALRAHLDAWLQP